MIFDQGCLMDFVIWDYAKFGQYVYDVFDIIPLLNLFKEFLWYKTCVIGKMIYMTLDWVTFG